MQLVANLAVTNWCENPIKWLKPWQMDIHLRVLSESYHMNTNMTGFLKMVINNFSVLVL